MGRKSNKPNKNLYQTIREEQGYSREKASEVLKCISPEKIEKIESGKITPHPEDILQMSIGYNNPNLCNYYCANECPIGKKYVPEIKIKELSQIILEMIASLNSVHKKQERLIEITEDGKIDSDEIEDFVTIQKELERVSISVETLQLWAERMLATGVIDNEEYKKYMEALQ